MGGGGREDVARFGSFKGDRSSDAAAFSSEGPIVQFPDFELTATGRFKNAPSILKKKLKKGSGNLPGQKTECYTGNGITGGTGGCGQCGPFCPLFHFLCYIQITDLVH